MPKLASTLTTTPRTNVLWRILTLTVALALIGVTLSVRAEQPTAAAAPTSASSTATPALDAARAALHTAQLSAAIQFAVSAVETATATLAEASEKVDFMVRTDLQRSIDRVAQHLSTPTAQQSLADLIATTADLDAAQETVRAAIVAFDLEQIRAAEAAAEAARLAAEQAAAEQAAAQKAAAEKAAAERAATRKSSAANTSQAADAPSPGGSIHDVGEAALRALPGNGGVSLSWDEAGLDGHLGGVWKGNTSRILVNSHRLSGKPSLTKDVIRHEMGHIYQGRLMAAHGLSWESLDATMSAAFGSNASEKVADCVAIRFGASWTNYTSNCSGADKQAWVDAFIGGYLP